MSISWKNIERRIARKFGVERTPLSGGSSRHTSSDTLHNDYYIEIKCSGVINISTKTGKKTKTKSIRIQKEVLDKMITNASKENKIPFLIFHFKSEKKDWVILQLDHFKCLLDLLSKEEVEELKRKM